MRDEPATELSGLDARIAQTGSRDRVASAPAEASGTDPEETWLDRVADLEPVGTGANELRKLAILHPNPEVRKSALEELAGANHELAFKSLVTSLEDDDLEVVALAIRELKSLDDRAAIEPLDRLARSHTDEQIQAAAQKAIEFLE
ncbi:MAG: HEAT repeat domain-containing protein [Deltaproteobacteria bacterium]|nr:HEAT repeat domain-containing protein [Deltaproteobacteria bacterium]MBW2724573.1 HEAT repeat domain-containing protein [Deltaproteobacteria bacterium]